MVTLGFILDQLLGDVPGGIGRYAENLAREVVKRAPEGTAVEGLTALITAEQEQLLHDRLPGLAGLRSSKLQRRALSKAWQHGLLTNAYGGGLIHAPSLYAPLREKSSGDVAQIVVTVHDTVPWTHPDTLTRNGVRWHKAMLKRAYLYADAVVAPTHAVADRLAELYRFRDRLRVIPGAASPDVRLPDDPDAVATRLGLPDGYILAVGTLEPRKGLDRLVRALAQPQLSDAVLVHAGPSGWGEVDFDRLCADAGVDRARVRDLGFITDAELAVAFDRATVYCMPSLDEGFGLPVLEAFKAGTPVVHSDAPALLEVSQGAALAVALDDADSFEQRLALALANVLSDAELRETLVTAGRDRVPIYSWAHSADLVWRLHAEI